MTHTTFTPPRRLVADARLEHLVGAYSVGSRHPLALLEVAGVVMFICPRCGVVGINGGTARIVDAWRWSCHSCRHVGTRYALEAIIVADAAMLEALYEVTG